MNFKQGITSIFLILISLFASPIIAYSQTLLLDYGPGSGTPYVSCWTNQQSGQNFAEKFSFPTDTLVEQIDIFTCNSNNSASVHIKILDDASGSPGTYLYQEDQTPSSWTIESPDIYRISCQLTTPFVAQANTTYWIGVAGNEGGITQLSIDLNTPDDGSMAQFSGSTFQNFTSVGDMMFQLYGETYDSVSPIPTLSEWGMIIMSLILAGSAIWMMRRRQVT